MKILHLISGGDTGGGKTHIFTLMKELHKIVDVEIACMLHAEFYDEAIALGLPIKLFLQSSRFDLSIVKKLEGYIRSNHYELIHCHGARANFIGYFLKKKLHLPFITTIHSDVEHDFDNHFMKKLVFTRLNKFSLQHMDYYLAVTENFREMLVSTGYPNERIYTIYNGVDIDDIDTLDERSSHILEEDKKAIAFIMEQKKAKKLVFGTATRLHPIKGTNVLLEAATLLLEKRDDFAICIAGTGEQKYYNEYMSYIKEHHLENHVFLIGFIHNIHSFYHQIDANILPSYSESFPYALTEGGLHALPTIASYTGGIPEMITNGTTGYLFEVGNPVPLADTMEKMLQSPSEYKKIGESFKEKILQDFTAVSMANTHKKIYADVLRLYHKKVTP